MKKILIIGAAGFVGLNLLRTLFSKSYQIYVLTKGNSEILIKNKDIISVEQNKINNLPQVDAIINLAYPSRSKPFEIRKDNLELFNIINRISNNNTKVIHISSIAVFGYGLDINTEPKPLKLRHDYPYVESKLYFEYLLQKKLNEFRNLDILRIGNVWGAGSIGWTFAIANKILFGEPVKVKNHDGFSNTTEINNLVSYIEFLINRDSSERIKFHHLAEFSYIKWSYWIEKFEEYFGIRAEVEKLVPFYPKSKITEYKSTLKMLSPTNKAKQIMLGRYTGAILRLLLRNLPISINKRIERKVNSSQLSNFSEPSVFLNTMSCNVEFKSVINKEWVPPVSKEKSWEYIKTWLDEIGYGDYYAK